MKRLLLILLCAADILSADSVRVPGLRKPVEILRDKWGVPHIYASNTHDLFFAQGYITAKDRLFQIDLWRRVGTGNLSEVLGPSMLERDKLARSVNFRGDWNQEWAAYGPDAREIVTAFTGGINAYIHSLNGHRPKEFERAGYDPAQWAPEDCLSRVAGLLMTGNLRGEVQHAQDAAKFGLAGLAKRKLFEPAVTVELPKGLDLADITAQVIRTYNQAVGPVALTAEQGSNNWVVDGTMTVTGRPILANDPHRPVQLPSLRKTVHLVAPGWNAIGSGEPGLPGIALGHNEYIAFGFTIVGIDQQDLYVETLNPDNPQEYRWRGAWKRFEVDHRIVPVKGQGAEAVDLYYTVHGPVIYRNGPHAFALRWVGSEPGTAGYLAGLSIARAKDWSQFEKAMAGYKVPSENVVYADTKGNIGWQVGGLTPVRQNWSGLLPVPGEGMYEWAGFRNPSELPHEFNPARHFIATANNNILPEGYSVPLGYDSWALPFRANRIRQMLTADKKFDIEDFERMQQDVASLPARRFQAVLQKWTPAEGSRAAHLVSRLTAWDGALRAESADALLYEVWLSYLQTAVLRNEPGARPNLELLLRKLEAGIKPSLMQETLDASLAFIEPRFGADETKWQWGALHKLRLNHPLAGAGFDLAPVARPGDANTVNATSGADFQQSNGASWREILDVGNWDRSVITNVPGESGDPASKHYSDLLVNWAAGRYHPLPYSRKAVEAVTDERIRLLPVN
ncbi:MAG: penicillin acylase family protein [Acidobacteriota bacterium]|nr:penicillin acylase family protein [Acidobacteriota bacterium]